MLRLQDKRTNEQQERKGKLIREERLIFAGKELDRGQTLAESNVSHDATLHLVRRLRSEPIGGGEQAQLSVNLETWYDQLNQHAGQVEQKITLDVNGSDTTEAVIQKIQEKEVRVGLAD